VSQQINLYSPIFLKQQKHFSAVTMLQALGLIMLGSALFYGYALYQVSDLSAQAHETEKKLSTEQARLAKIAEQYAPLEKSTLLEQEIARLEVLVKARQEIVGVLKNGALGSTNGYSRYMQAFARQSVGGLWLTAFDITGDGNELAISGRTLRPELIPVYVQRLSQELVMKGHQFASLQISQPQAAGAGEKSAGLRYLEFTLHSSEFEKSQAQPGKPVNLPLPTRLQSAQAINN
jgi:Tfp pilus assembly protein PilN